eukprot:4919970-Pyramimonas_sp.AAC.1
MGPRQRDRSIQMAQRLRRSRGSLHRGYQAGHGPWLRRGSPEAHDLPERRRPPGPPRAVERHAADR